MKVVTFELHLLEPLLATQVGGGDPNSAVGLDFIPGSAIRGMVIARYRRQNRADAADERFRRLFLDGSARFLNAYPQAYGRRTLPVPLSWHVPKGKERPVRDLALSAPQKDHHHQWQRTAHSFCHLWQTEEAFEGIHFGLKARVEWVEPEKHINIHVAREDRQRIVKGESTVFRYEALVPGQVFCGVILVDREEDLKALQECFQDGDIVTLGGSHLAGYGKVRLQNVRIQEDWREYEPVGDEETGTLIVTLLSDALIRDLETGAYMASLEPILRVKHQQAFVATRIVGGFNRKWNLPLPQAQAVRAGSVFVYPAQNGLLERLRALAEQGIGERRAEGFGRIALNWHRASEVEPQEKPQPSLPLSVTLKQETSKNLARQMVERMLREKLDRDVTRTIHRLRIQNPPSNTQLSRVRIAARQALTQNNPEAIIRHLDAMRKAAREQFRSARIDGERLDEWLRDRAKNPESIWDLLGIDRRRLPTVGDVQPKLDKDLALEYTVRLIDAVLHKAQKEVAR